jgi:hypothetical protein
VSDGSIAHVKLKDQNRSMSGKKKKRPERFVALEKQPQQEMSCGGCF